MKTKRSIALSIGLALIAFAALACSKGGGNSTPTEAFQTFYNSIKNKDVASAKKVMRKKTLEMMEGEAKKKNKALDDFLKDEFMEQLGKKMPASLPETRNEKIEGENATLEMKDGEDWRPTRFFKEEDGWKVNM